MALAANSLRKLAVVLSAFLVLFFIFHTSSRTSWDRFDRPPLTPQQQGSSSAGLAANPPQPNDQPRKDGRPSSSPRSRLSLQMQEHLEWNPPLEIKEHYPPYSDYRNRDYDPNRWEDFEQNNDLYLNGTMDRLERDDRKPIPYDPYPDYHSEEYKKQWRGQYVPCIGPWGKPYDKSSDQILQAYKGVPKGFPIPDSGTFEGVGLDNGVCFDRHVRLGPYGAAKEDGSKNDFSGVNWMDLQNNCMQLNKDRYENSALPKLGPDEEEEKKRSVEKRDAQAQVVEGGDTAEKHQPNEPPQDQPKEDDSSKPHRPRTAILIRGWDDYKYEDNDFQAIRSMITEVNLLSGGEYHVFLFVNVKDPQLPIFTEKKVYDAQLALHVPEELRDIAILWTEAVSYSWYQNVGEWSVYFQQFMPVQWFYKTHPEFDYIWNWEMDARYIGNHYHFLETIKDFARNQPRKYLWERNARYYFPAVHGSYENFTRETNRIVKESPHIKPVWGPDTWRDDQVVYGPHPPTTEEEDDFSWGVGEEADFITLLPMWDPRETFWSYRDKLWNYGVNKRPSGRDDRPYSHVPRRTFINTVVRLSKRLLEAMHQENVAGYSMASEMWPSSVALQHGFKAVYAPHPIWFSHIWPSDYLEEVINADGWGAGSGIGDTEHGRGVAYDSEREIRGLQQQGTGPNKEGRLGRWGQERDSPYSPDREHNFAGWSWYFWSDLPRVMYWRWQGWKSSFNIVTIQGVQSNDELRGVDWAENEREHGRLCYPAMLLHPVKRVKPPEEPKEDQQKSDVL